MILVIFQIRFYLPDKKLMKYVRVKDGHLYIIEGEHFNLRVVDLKTGISVKRFPVKGASFGFYDESLIAVFNDTYTVKQLPLSQTKIDIQVTPEIITFYGKIYFYNNDGKLISEKEIAFSDKKSKTLIEYNHKISIFYRNYLRTYFKSHGI